MIRLLADGLTYGQTAARLEISAQTAQVHVRHVYAQLDAHGKVSAIRRSSELGII